ncbi:MAG TPA: Panacea domain-containing protein [Stellaceae bacterium]|nr:Panacea domain-containing protein [Stellaceae bacterium]
MGYQPPIQFDRQKFKEVILYICARTARDRLGAVKLNKTLYYSDMLQFAFTGHPITGAKYRKRPFGPTADDVLPALRGLVKEGALKIETEKYFGYTKTIYVPLREPDESQLHESERSLLNDAIEFVCNQNTAKTISEFSHNMAWEMVTMGEEIPYHSAFSLFPLEVSLEATDWANSVAPEIEAERSKRPEMDYETFAAFRSRVHEARR